MAELFLKTTTNIGQIENPQQLAPGLPQGISSLIPVDGGADDPFQGAPEVSFDTVTEGVSNLAEDVSSKISTEFDAWAENPVDKAVELGTNVAFATARDTVANMVPGKFSPPIIGGLFDVAKDMFEGKDFNPTKAATNLGLGFLAAAFPAFTLPIVALKGLFSLVFDNEGLDAEDLEDMGYNIDMDIAPPGTFGPEPGPTYTGSYSEPESPVDLEDMGYDIDMDIGPPESFSEESTEAPDSPDADADADADGPGPGPGDPD